MKIPEVRRSEVGRIVLERGRASITELAEELKVSEETVRRDLNVLHEKGLVVKVHGGAITPDRPGLGTYEKRQLSQASEKRRIALAATKLFTPGSSIMIDAGSTPELVAEYLAPRGAYTVITNSMTIARQFWRNSDGSTVIMLGGELRVDTEDTLGEITLNQLAGFNADHAILAAAGVSETGDIMRYRIDEVMIARAMVARAREVTIVADHTKFESIAPMNICGLQQVTNLVTDRPVSDSFAELAARSGTNLVIASTNSGG